MINFWLSYSHVDEDTLTRAAIRTRATLESVAPEAHDCWKARGVWKIESGVIAWASAWEIESYYCNSTVEAQTFHNLRVRSEYHCERVFDAMLAMEEATHAAGLARLGLAV